MELIPLAASAQHEQVVLAADPAIGYRAIIAIHSTRRGPAVGGTRLWTYRSDDDALHDALRLSSAMTLKNAVADLPFGGGKSVIMRPPGAFDRRRIMEAHGAAVDSLGGRYITAEDVGTSADDMDLIATTTRHVLGRPLHGGDPSPFTARGGVRALQAAVQFTRGADALAGLAVVIQGLGNVGIEVARMVTAEGALVRGADVDAARIERAVREPGLQILPPEQALEAEADAVMPCALGGVLHADAIARLRCRMVTGVANNQLETDADALRLHDRGIVYVPDFVANAGGVISGAADLLGWSAQALYRKIDAIYDTALAILRQSEARRVTPQQVAVEMAQAAVG